MMTIAQLKSLYRVDNVPWRWKIPYWILGYGLGWMTRTYYCLIFYTSRIETTGQESLVPGKNYIYSLWHTAWPIYFSAFIHLKKHAWICHPAWYMKGVLVTMERAGIKALLGSTGNFGKQAANALVADLKNGYSTAISPDGPYGPFRTVKKGILHVSQQSGVPIVAVSLSATWAWRACGPDQKQFPLPFGRIAIHYSPPIAVTETNFDSVIPKLSRRMD